MSPYIDVFYAVLVGRTLASLPYLQVNYSTTDGVLPEDDPLEYCERTTFTVTCQPDEVVLIKSARYGRMKVGKCISADFGNLGCHVDVRHFLDSKCSGRHNCSVPVSTVLDNIPSANLPCERDLKEFRGYLEASYDCIKVVYETREKCMTSSSVAVTSPFGYLSSTVTDDTLCGTVDRPWSLLASPGQTYRLRLFDFSIAAASSAHSSGQQRICHVYAVIKETAIQSSETICSGAVRESEVFKSITNALEIRFVRRKDGDSPRFLLQFEVIGCPDLTSSSMNLLERSGNTATFGCGENNQRWTVTCENGKWVGPIMNCSSAAKALESTSDDLLSSGFMGVFTGYQWAALIIILTIAVLIGLTIFFVGFFYIKRRRSRMELRAQTYVTDPQYASSYQTRRMVVGNPQIFGSKSFSLSDSNNYSSTENDYYRTWQLQRHPTACGVSDPRAQRLPCTGHCLRPEPPAKPQRVVEHIYESPKFDRKESTAEFGDAMHGHCPMQCHEANSEVV